KKNVTDAVDSVPIINFRYLTTLIVPIVTTLKPFLAAKGHSPEDVDKMHQAWLKSVILQITLWSRPYIKDGQF
ncbi:MAG: protoglobin domain-containing protein, partial [Dehalococcoidia bacterium]